MLICYKLYKINIFIWPLVLLRFEQNIWNAGDMFLKFFSWQCVAITTFYFWWFSSYELLFKKRIRPEKYLLYTHVHIAKYVCHDPRTNPANHDQGAWDTLYIKNPAMIYKCQMIYKLRSINMKIMYEFVT